MSATDESRRCDITAHDHCSLFEEDLRQAIKKLSTMFPDQVTVRLDEFADFLSVLPAVQAAYDPESFCTMLRAVVGRRRLKMV
jgi:hypothetical protein